MFGLLTKEEADRYEADVDEDGTVPSLQTFEAPDGDLGVETRYARLENVYLNEHFVGVIADDGGEGFVEVRVPWRIFEAIQDQRKGLPARKDA